MSRKYNRRCTCTEEVRCDECLRGNHENKHDKCDDEYDNLCHPLFLTTALTMDIPLQQGLAMVVPFNSIVISCPSNTWPYINYNFYNNSTGVVVIPQNEKALSTISSIVNIFSVSETKVVAALRVNNQLINQVTLNIGEGKTETASLHCVYPLLAGQALTVTILSNSTDSKIVGMGTTFSFAKIADI